MYIFLFFTIRYPNLFIPNLIPTDIAFLPESQNRADYTYMLPFSTALDLQLSQYGLVCAKSARSDASGKPYFSMTINKLERGGN